MNKPDGSNTNGEQPRRQLRHLDSERYEGTLLVKVPPVRWYELNVPYSSELERKLAPAIHFEEDAILVAPDKFTALMLKIESFPKHIPIVIGEKEARQLAEAKRRTTKGQPPQ